MLRLQQEAAEQEKERRRKEQEREARVRGFAKAAKEGIERMNNDPRSPRWRPNRRPRCVHASL